MAAILAFLSSPLGLILIKYVPDLVGQIIKSAHETGHDKPQEWLTYIQTRKQWDEVPK